MSSPWTLCLLVGLGGFAGSLARYALSLAGQRLDLAWPAGTLTANVLGCLIIGMVTALTARGEVLSPETRLALATGFCGGFTTLSSMVYETAEMVRASEYLHASGYAAGTFLLGMTAFLAGSVAVRAVFGMGGG
jgi:CrcB protein